ncbi:MAG: hypothetical protein GX981_07325 [Tissierellia bacterium]|nr:hypothetical protein [Tissierellia bacterium]
MKKVISTVLRLYIGLFVCAIGIVMTINADLGLSPWDTFHQGLSNLTGLTIGKVYILLGIFIVILDTIMGERVGWGTLSNMIFLGVFIDILMLNDLIPKFEDFLPSLLMMLIGLLILGFGIFLYVSVGLGSGPRDGLMIALTKKTKKPVALIKASIESIALLAGYFLGGSIGIGTLIMAVGGGLFTQLAFKIVGFNVEEIEHRFVDDDIKMLLNKFKKNKTEEGLSEEDEVKEDL